MEVEVEEAGGREGVGRWAERGEAGRSIPSATCVRRVSSCSASTMSIASCRACARESGGAGAQLKPCWRSSRHLDAFISASTWRVSGESPLACAAKASVYACRPIASELKPHCGSALIVAWISTALAVCHFCSRSPCIAAFIAPSAAGDLIWLRIKCDDVIVCSSVRPSRDEPVELSARRATPSAVELSARCATPSAARAPTRAPTGGRRKHPIDALFLGYRRNCFATIHAMLCT